jgi:hypothetical protein
MRHFYNKSLHLTAIPREMLDGGIILDYGGNR